MKRLLSVRCEARPDLLTGDSPAQKDQRWNVAIALEATVLKALRADSAQVSFLRKRLPKQVMQLECAALRDSSSPPLLSQAVLCRGR